MALLFSIQMVLIFLGVCMCNNTNSQGEFLPDGTGNKSIHCNTTCLSRDKFHDFGSRKLAATTADANKLKCLCMPSNGKLQYENGINGGSEVPQGSAILNSVFRLKKGGTATFTNAADYLTTAAHVTMWNDYKEGETETIDNGYESYQITIAKSFVHPDYGHFDETGQLVIDNATHDVSVLWLNNYVLYVKPLVIDYSIMKNDAIFDIYGYGFVNEKLTPASKLKTLDMIIMDDGTSDGDVQIAIGLSNGSACKGDSGSPTIYRQGSKYCGLVSGGHSLIHPTDLDACDYFGEVDIAPFAPNKDFFEKIFMKSEERNKFVFKGRPRLNSTKRSNLLHSPTN